MMHDWNIVGAINDLQVEAMFSLVVNVYVACTGIKRTRISHLEYVLG